jgi:lysophospholipase L1-like esterase
MGAASSSTSDLAQEENWSKPTKDVVAFLGRVQVDADGSALWAWSGSGFRVKFMGTGLQARFVDRDNFHSVSVDGQAPRSIEMRAGQVIYALASGLPLGEHTVEVRRRTEALFGVTHLLGLRVEAGRLLAAPPSKARSLELVGDSISCGYGNEGSGPACPFSAATENHDRSYGRLLAGALDAELSTVAWSGRGVVKNYAGEPGDLMPTLYERVLPQVAASSWSFTRSADVVIVNLGTNDFSTEPDPEFSQFRDAYAALLATIRARNPRAFVVCTLGPMLPPVDLQRAERAIQAAIQLRTVEGDQRVSYFPLGVSNDAPGCDWHPSVATHERMAKALIPVVRRLTGW